MLAFLQLLGTFVANLFKSRHRLEVENLWAMELKPKKNIGQIFGEFTRFSKSVAGRLSLQIPELFMLIVTSGLRINAQRPPNGRI
jgi:hypothetical protein